jgi:hypothetical protein
MKYLNNYKNFLNEKQNISENFEKWFKDSKIVNKNGDPLILYHGTYSIFNEFKPSTSIGTHGETDQIKGIYFTDNKNVAMWYTPKSEDSKYLKKVYLSIKNPYIVHNPKILLNQLKIDNYSNVDKILKKLGYDGLIIEEGFYTLGGPWIIYLAFYSNQIKIINEKK